MPPDLTPPWISPDFANLPDPDPGNLFIADGQLLDQSGNVIGAFAEGVQVAAVPEPSSLVLLVAGLALILPIDRRRLAARGRV